VGDGCNPRNWLIEGSKNGEEWIILDEEQDNENLRENDFCCSFKISHLIGVHQIRLRQTGQNHKGNNFLALSGFEVFGLVIEN
jgi:hypothetical protein